MQHYRISILCESQREGERRAHTQIHVVNTLHQLLKQEAVESQEKEDTFSGQTVDVGLGNGIRKTKYSKHKLEARDGSAGRR